MVKKCFLCDLDDFLYDFNDETFKNCLLKLAFRKKKCFKYNQVELTKASLDFVGYHAICYKKVTALGYKYNAEYKMFVRKFSMKNSDLDFEQTKVESPAAPQSASLSSKPEALKRRRYRQAPKYRRSKGIRAKEDELMSLASQAIKKFCSGTLDTMQNSPSDFDIAGMKYARDLASIAPTQRNFAEKLVADAMFYAKQGKLTKYSSLQLCMRSSYSNNNNF